MWKDIPSFLLSPLFLLFGPITVISLFSTSALQSGSFERRTSDRKKVFSQPDAVPVFLVSLFVFLAAMIWVIIHPAVLQALPTTFDGSYVRTHWTGPALTTGLVIALLYGAALHWWHKKYVLVLDWERHCYRTLDTSKFMPAVRTGSWDEISGIAVRGSSAKGGSTYFVVLKWKQASKRYSTLGGFSRADKAAAYARRLSEELHLPLVASL